MNETTACRPYDTGSAATSCIIYTRFSPRKNSDTCESCEVQMAYCEEFANRKGWRVAAAFEDRAVSGSVDINAREIHNAIAALKKGDVLLAYRRDRLARDLIIGLEIERAVASRGATVAVVEGDIFGDSNDPGVVMMKQMLMVINEYERKIIAARTKAAMIHHIRNGRNVGGRTPYGFSRDPRDPGHFIRNEKEQAVVADIMDRYARGDSTHKIAREIPPEGSRVGHWHPGVIRNIIKHELRGWEIPE